MKTVLLAGGLGSRLSEETVTKPKPMVEIGGYPILWHIMRMYAEHGFKEFVVALGYKGYMIKDYFLSYFYRSCDISIALNGGSVNVHGGTTHDWTIHLIDTGQQTQTGGRLKRLAQWLGKETFLMTYGDGVSNVNIKDVLAFHRKHGKLATLVAVRPPARFGSLMLESETVREFREKPQIGEGWINGGFFVLEPKVLDYIENDGTYFERAPLQTLAENGQLAAYEHGGFWQCMDTVRDVQLLENLWQSGNAPWKVWKGR